MSASGSNLTLKEYRDKWLDHIKDDLAASTYQEYAAVLKNHVYPAFGDKPFSKITRAMIRDLISAKRKEGYDASTIRNILAPVRGMYNQAADDGAPIANPAARMGKRNKRSDPKAEINPYTREEVPVMLQKALHSCRCTIPCSSVQFGPALGKANLLRCGASDIDYENRLIHVQHTLSRGTLKPPKNGKARWVDMSKQLAGVLRELKRKPDDWLFHSSNKTQIDASNLRKMWKRFQKDAEAHSVP